MKQLTILCSSDLAARVRDALVHAGVERFLNVPHAVGNKPAAGWEHGRWPTWEAEMFVAPVDDAAVPAVVEELREYTGCCETEPCLHVLVSALEAAY